MKKYELRIPAAGVFFFLASGLVMAQGNNTLNGTRGGSNPGDQIQLQTQLIDQTQCQLPDQTRTQLHDQTCTQLFDQSQTQLCDQTQTRLQDQTRTRLQDQTHSLSQAKNREMKRNQSMLNDKSGFKIQNRKNYQNQNAAGLQTQANIQNHNNFRNSMTNEQIGILENKEMTRNQKRQAFKKSLTVEQKNMLKGE